MALSRINVFITVDVEHSIGGAFRSSHLRPVGNNKRVYGSIGQKQFGIPLIMDVANAHGIRLTFFVEVLNRYYFGLKETRSVCEYILKRGHDIQLHLHPNYLNFTLRDPQQQTYNDLIGTYSPVNQAELIAEGIEILSHDGVPRPIAFRAGGFSANDATLKALKANRLFIDSSYNLAYIGSSCLLKDKGINDLAPLDEIWELPITNFIEHTIVRSERHIPLDINGASIDEIMFVLEQARTGGPNNITILMHSFSFIKPYDVQYIKSRPRRHVISRFEALCRYLQNNSNAFAVRTIGSLTNDVLSDMAPNSVHLYPRIPARLSIMRLFQQLKDNLF